MDKIIMAENELKEEVGNTYNYIFDRFTEIKSLVKKARVISNFCSEIKDNDLHFSESFMEELAKNNLDIDVIEQLERRAEILDNILDILD